MIQTFPHFLSRKCIHLIHTLIHTQIPYQIWKLELLIKIACEDFWRKITFYQVLNTQSKKLCKLSTKKCLILNNNNKKYTKQILFHNKLFWQEMLSTLRAGKQRSCWNSHLLPTASSAACSHESCSYPVQSTECKDKAVEDKWATQDSFPFVRSWTIVLLQKVERRQ